jgi:hypothetical protein
MSQQFEMLESDRNIVVIRKVVAEYLFLVQQRRGTNVVTRTELWLFRIAWVMKTAVTLLSGPNSSLIQRPTGKESQNQVREYIAAG